MATTEQRMKKINTTKNWNRPVAVKALRFVVAVRDGEEITNPFMATGFSQSTLSKANTIANKMPELADAMLKGYSPIGFDDAYRLARQTN